MLTDIRRLRSTARWQKLRAMVIRRQKGVCALCGIRLIREVHHKVMATPGNMFDETNLVGLCVECHDRVHAAYNMGFKWEDIGK